MSNQIGTVVNVDGVQLLEMENGSELTCSGVDAVACPPTPPRFALLFSGLDGDLPGRDGTREDEVEVKVALIENDKADEVAADPAVDVVTGLIMISSFDGGAMAYNETL